MLFLNRRGYAGFVSCRSCGHVMKCPHCDVALSEHHNRRLICHYCGYETAKPEKCPVCSSPYIGGFKAGTQQIQQVVEKEFPEGTCIGAGRCILCRKCARTEGKACRYPQLRRYSITAFGFDFSRMVKDNLGMELLWSSNGVPEYDVAVAALFHA